MANNYICRCPHCGLVRGYIHTPTHCPECGDEGLNVELDCEYTGEADEEAYERFLAQMASLEEELGLVEEA